jgi:hypothetical protein
MNKYVLVSQYIQGAPDIEESTLSALGRTFGDLVMQTKALAEGGERCAGAPQSQMWTFRTTKAFLRTPQFLPPSGHSLVIVHCAHPMHALIVTSVDEHNVECSVLESRPTGILTFLTGVKLFAQQAA